LTLEYPGSWQQVSGDPTPSFAGDDGFFAIDGTASPDTVTAVCQAQVAAPGHPFGSSPTIEATTVGGQEACLIHPSADQPAGAHRSARVVARLPYELFSVGFNFLVLDVDPAHVRAIAQSIQFLGHD
jgi:TolB protein